MDIDLGAYPQAPIVPEKGTEMLRVRTVLSGWPGGPGLNTFYFTTTAPSTPAAGAPDVVARVRAFWSSIGGLFPASFSAQVQGQVDDLDPSNGQLLGTYNGGAPAQVLGSTGTSYNAYATSLLLRINSAYVTAGRRVAGRAFIGPVAAALDAGGIPTTLSLNTLVAGATGMLTGTTTAGAVIWHRPTLTTPGAAFGVSNYSGAPYFAVLRSRRD